MTRSAVVLGFALCGGLVGNFAQTPQSPGNRVIAGAVVNAASRQPIPDADVVLGDTNGFKRVEAMKSDALGRFSFANLPDGKYVLSAAHAGYVAAAYEEHEGPFTAIVTGEDQVTTGLVLELPPMGAIFGTVTEDSGDPVPRANITVFRRDNREGAGSIQRYRNDAADSMGRFEIPGLMPSEYFLCVSGAPWYRPSNTRSILNTGGANLPPSPLDVAYPVSCYPDTADPAGSEPITIRAGDRVEANMTLHPVPSVHIQMRVQRSNPQEGFYFPQVNQEIFGVADDVHALMDMQPTRGINHEMNQDQNTQIVEISGIAPGQYTLELRKPNQAQGTPLKVNVDVPAEGLSIDDSSFRQVAQVTGKLLLSNGECPNSTCSIALVREGEEEKNSYALAPDGSFQIPQVAPGNYEVRVRSDVVVSLVVKELRVNATRIAGPQFKVGNDPVSLTVVAVKPMGSLTGFVTRNGKPESGVFLALVPAELNARGWAWMRNQSDSDGSFIITDVAPGQYTLVAIERGWSLEWRKPEVISRYLANGLKVTVGSDSRTLKFDKTVEAQIIH